MRIKINMRYKTKRIINKLLVSMIVASMVLGESQFGNMPTKVYASEVTEEAETESYTITETSDETESYTIAETPDETNTGLTTELDNYDEPEQAAYLETTEEHAAGEQAETESESDNVVNPESDSTDTTSSVSTEDIDTEESSEEAEVTIEVNTEAAIEIDTETATEEQMIGLNPLEQLNGTTSADGENIETASETQLEDMIVSGDMTLTSDMTVGNLDVPKNATLKLNGYTLTVEGNSTIKGNVEFGKGELLCYNDINISSDACITMDNANDYMIAYGRMTYYGESKLTAGVIELKGDFTANNSFVAEGTHKVIFSGDFEQKISVSDEGSFNDVELRNFSAAGLTVICSFNYNSLTDNDCVINYEDLGGERGYTLTEDTEFNGTYYLVSDTLDLNGYTMTINGDLIQAGGTINVNGGKLIINGSYRVQSRSVKDDTEVTYGKSTGALTMADESDYIYIDGDFISETATDHTGKLTEGVMEITGDVDVSFAYSKYAFVASNNHTVILSGEKEQNVSVDMSNRQSNAFSQLRNLVMNNSSEEGLNIDGLTLVSGKVLQNSCKVSGMLGFSSDTDFDGDEYNGDIVSIDSNTYISNSLTLNGNLYLTNTLRVLEDVTINGNIASYKKESSQTLILGTNSLYINGDSTDVNYSMQDDMVYVYIGGSLIGTSQSMLRKGTLELKGDLNVEKYSAYSTHKTILSGDVLQSITNADKVSFGTLELQNYSEDGVYSDVPFFKITLIRNGCNLRYGNVEGEFGWKLSGDYICDGDFVLLDDTLDLNGYTLTVNGDYIQFSGITKVNNGKLIVNGNYRMQSIVSSDGEKIFGKSSGALYMNQPNDYVYIFGDYIHDSESSNRNSLTIGTMEIKGNIVADYFECSHTHKVVLSGVGAQQIGTGYNSKTTFASLEVNNSGTEELILNGTVSILKDVKQNGSKFVGTLIGNTGMKFLDRQYYGDVRFNDDYTFNNNVVIHGDLINYGELIIPNYYSITVKGDYTNYEAIEVNGEYVVEGDYIQSYSSTLDMISGKLIIKGNADFENISSYGISMKEGTDQIVVYGDFNYYSPRYTLTLDGGYLDIKGNVSIDTRAIVSEKYRLILSGDKLQTVSLPEGVTWGIIELQNYSQDGVYSERAFSKKSLIRNGCKLKYGDTVGEFGWRLTGNQIWDGDLILLEDTLDLNGYTLTVTGNLIHQGGDIDINKGMLEIMGDYRIQTLTKNEGVDTFSSSAGRIVMDESEDKIIINGEFFINTTSDNNNSITDGVIEINNNIFIEERTAEHFSLKDNATILLCGEDKQTINVAEGRLTLTNVTNMSEEYTIGNNGSICVQGHIKGYGFDDEIYITKDTTFADNSYSGDVILEDNYVIPNHMLVINGNCRITGDTLSMQGDASHLLVRGDLILDNKVLGIDKGIIELKGDLIVTPHNYNNLNNGLGCSGTSKFVMSGDEIQNIVQSRPDVVELKFNEMEINNTSGEGVCSDYYFYCKNLDNKTKLNINSGKYKSGYTLTEDTSISGDLYLGWGTFDLNGYTLYVSGDVINAGSVVKINGGKLEVGGDYKQCVYNKSGEENIVFASCGSLIMNSEDDEINVGGDFRIDYNSLDSGINTLSLGEISVKGDFAITGYSSGYSKLSIGSKVNLTGTTKQVVEGNMTFRRLSIQNQSEVELKNNYTVAEELWSDCNNISGVGRVSLYDLDCLMTDSYNGNLNIINACTLDKDITIDGELTVNSTMQLNNHYLTVDVMNLNSSLHMEGGSLNCVSVLNINNNAKLVMTNDNDMVSVGEAINFKSKYNHSNYLTAGVIELKGDFTSGYNGSFCPTGNHTVILESKLKNSGKDYTPTISFLSSDSTSKFNVLVLKNTEDKYVFSRELDNMASEVIFDVPEYEELKPITNLKYTELGVSRVKLEFDCEDSGRMLGYEIYRNGEKVGATGTTSYIDTDIYPNSIYVYQVYGFDKYWNYTSESPMLTVTTEKDITAPSVPDDLSITEITGGTISLEWAASSDDDRVKGYNIYRDEVFITCVTDMCEFRDSGLSSNTSYCYNITAVDRVGNESELSDSVEAKPQTPNITWIEPTDGQSLKSDIVSLEMKFDKLMSDSEYTVHMEYYDDETHRWKYINSEGLIPADDNVISARASMEWDISGLKGDEYDVRYIVRDSEGYSSSKTVTYFIDKTAPGIPANVQIESVKGVINLSWELSSAYDCSGYNIFRRIYDSGDDFELIYTEENQYTSSYIDKNGVEGVLYEYAISAFDEAGNESSKSDYVKAKVVKDDEAPTVENMTPEAGRVNGKVNIEIIASDNKNTDFTELYIKKDGEDTQLKLCEITMNEGKGDYELDTTKYDDGVYYVSAMAVDSSGNVSTETYLRRYEIDNTGIGKIKLEDVTYGDTYVSLRWQDVTETDFSHFVVEQLKSGKYVAVATSKDTLGYNVTNLAPDTTYKFRVVGYDDLDNRGICSDEYTVKTQSDSQLPVIKSVNPVQSSYSKNISLSVSGTDNDCVSGARFYYSYDKVNYTLIADVRNQYVTKDATLKYEFNVAEHPEGTMYIKFQIYDRAGNNNVTSGNGEEIVCEYDIDHTAPAKPSNLKAKSNQGNIELCWDKDDNVSSYKIYRATLDEGIYSLVESNYKYVNYYDIDIECNETYLYKLAAVDMAGNVSMYSDVVSATAFPDSEKPVIEYVYPKKTETIGENTNVSVMVTDNSKLKEIKAQIKDSVTGSWRDIHTGVLKDKNVMENISLDLTGMNAGEYTVRFKATDVAGNTSDYHEVTYILDNEAPEMDYQVTTGDFCIDISLLGDLPEDYDHYEVYRRRKSAGNYNYYQFKEVAVVWDSILYKDEDVEPWYDYEYKLYIYDKYDNCYETPIKVSYATDNDTVAPVLNVPTNVRTIEDMEICIDAGESYDNVRIETITWEISDGTLAIGRKLSHTFTHEGEYQIKVTATDNAGNQSEAYIDVQVLSNEGNGVIHIKVVDDIGYALPYSYIYMNDTNDSSVCYRTDGQGMLTLSSKVGDYKIAAYKANYIPKDIDVTVSQYEENSYTITLPKGDVIVGDISVHRMSLGEMEMAGVNFSDPSNYNTFQLDINLGFAQTPIPVVTTKVSKADFDSGGGIGIDMTQLTDSEDGGGTGADQGGILPPGPGGSSKPSERLYVYTSGTEECEEPILVYLRTQQTVSWLKDMYTVNLQVLNTADYQFVVKNSVANIVLPGGLSLATTYEGQSNNVNLGDIYGQESKSVSWIVKGDCPGDYEIEATFEGALYPFNQLITATFKAEQTIAVDDYEGVVIYVRPEDTAYSGYEYFIQFEIYNGSGRDLYNVSTSFGDYVRPGFITETYVVDSETGETTKYSSVDGNEQVIEEPTETMQSPIVMGQESVKIKILSDGKSLYGTYVCKFEADTNPNEFGHELVESMVRCINAKMWGVKVEVEPIPGHIDKTIYNVEYINTLIGDPVDVTTGAYTDYYEVISIAGENTLSVDLSYNSMYSTIEGEVGYGWSHNFESYIDAKNGMIHYYTSPYAYASFYTESSLDGVKYGKLDGDSLILDNTASDGDVRYRSITHGMEDYVLVRHADGTYTVTTPAGYIFEYNADGKLITMVIEGGASSSIAHGNNQITVTEDQTGNYIKLDYNQGKLIKVTDNTGRSSMLSYTDGYLTSITNPAGDKVSYEYDESGRLITGKNTSGEVFVTNFYDSEGRVVKQIDGNGFETSFEYADSDGGLETTMTAADGSNIITITDSRGNIIKTVSPTGAESSFEYDNNGNRTKAVDAYGNVYNYSYDAKGNMTHYDMNGESELDVSYDEFGNVISTSSDEGNAGSYTYDDKGNLIYGTDGLMSYAYTYNDEGNPTSIERVGKGITSYNYDESGVYVKSITGEDGHTSYMDYDSYGNIISVKDAMGAETRFEYDALNRMVKQVNPDGGSISYTYDEYGNVTSVTDPMGYKTLYSYDAGGRHLSTTFADGTAESFSYDGVGNLIAATASDGRSVTYEYDMSGNVTKVTYPDGTYQEYTYDLRGQICSSTDVMGNKASYDYNDAGDLCKITTAEGVTITPEFGAGRSITKVTDGSGSSSALAYDAYGNITSMTDALGNTTSYTYSPWGELLTESDANGNVTSYTYDTAGRCTSVTNPDGTSVNVVYDACGRVDSKYVVKDSGERYGISYIYDSMGRVSSYKDEMGNTTSYKYDLNGNLISVTDSEGVVTEYTYDCMGKVLQEKTASDIVISYNYNKSDLVEKAVMTSPTGEEKTYTYTYDDMGRVLTVTDPSGNVSSQSYDKAGNVTELVYPEGGGISYSYDSFGRLTEEKLSIGTTSKYEYNSDSLLSQYTNGRGLKTEYSYDELGRITSFTDELGTVSYNYDANGNILTVSETDKSGKTKVISRTYDCMDRVTSYTDCNGNTVRYGYDELGNLISLTYPGGEIIRYSYDKVGLLTTVTDEEGFVTSYSYDKVGRLHTTTKPDGSVETNTYDKLSRLTQRTVVGKDGKQINKYSYIYDSWGNIVSIVSEGDGEKGDNTTVLSSATMTYDSSNRMVTYNGEDIIYDDDGNMLYGPLDGEMVTFTYDCRNRLISAGDTTYEYDAENIRTAVETPEYREEYVTDSVGELSRVLVITREYKTSANEENSSTDNHVETENYYYGNGLIYEKSSEVGVLVYHYNHLGSTTAVTDKDGKLVYSYDYGTYGELVSTTEYSNTTPTIRFLYNGQLGVATDGNGLYYMRSRYYNPDIKRFINQDVLIGSIGNSNSLNRYSYVEGNPVSYTDPFGLSPYKWISLGIHTALDVAGIWFPVADVANAFYYLFEGNPVEFGKSLILAIPGSDFLSIGTKFSAKLGKYSKLSEGIVKGVNAAGHIGSAAIMAYETGSAIGKMIDKYLVYDNELSKETAVEVGLIVLGCYGTAKYSDILAKYMGGLGGSVRPAKVTVDAGGTSTKTNVTRANDTSARLIKLDLQFFAYKGGTSSKDIIGTSYDINKLKKTQPYTYPSGVNKYKKMITSEGPNSIEPIPVRVHNGEVLIVDGHHRYEAFYQLGYKRVPIKYLHKTNLGKQLPNGDYYRTLEELLRDKIN